MRFFLPKEDAFFELFQKLNGSQKEMASLLIEFCGHFHDGDEYQRRARTINPYGDGQAARRIAEALLRT